jgi:class 3 adenylate cyclase
MAEARPAAPTGAIRAVRRKPAHAPGRTAPVYHGLWVKVARNILAGTLISVVPGLVFYSAAFSYTPAQMATMMPIALVVVSATLAVDLSLTRIYLAPVKAMEASPQDGRLAAQAFFRLHNLPIFSFVRVFGPHALTASTLAQVSVAIANARWGLGIPSKDYWVYWLLNLTLVPIGHAVFEYHANGWAAREALASLYAGEEEPPGAAGIRRVGLATRVAVFYTLLAVPPLILFYAALSLRDGRTAGAMAGWGVVRIIAGVAALNFLLLLLFASDVRRSTSSLLEGLRKAERGDLSAHLNLFSPDEFGVIADGVNKMIRGLRDRQRIRELFGLYLSPAVSRAILEGKLQTDGESREVTVLFCDIRDFTAFSQSRTPRQVVERLNGFFERMSTAVDSYGGFINKFLGDGFLAVFGAPGHATDHARRAVEAALAMELSLRTFNQELARAAEPPLEVGIGLDTGEVVVGNVGSRNRLEYTVIGGAANRSSRIEQLNKILGTRILVSEHTYRKCGLGGGRGLGAQKVRGLDQPLILVTIGERA